MDIHFSNIIDRIRNFNSKGLLYGQILKNDFKKELHLTNYSIIIGVVSFN